MQISTQMTRFSIACRWKSIALLWQTIWGHVLTSRYRKPKNIRYWNQKLAFPGAILNQSRMRRIGTAENDNRSYSLHTLK